MKYRKCLYLVLMMAAMLLAGCHFFSASDDGEDLAYDICDETMLPEELAAVINTKKEEEFKFTYSNNTYTYIVVCAGTYDRADVSVDVDELYKDDNAIYVKTVLRQNSDAEQDMETVVFPYVVIRILKSDLQVIFK